ncbi:MAG: YgaP family membrane protein [Flavobacteriales bacterium]|jgi:hypothetical protein
MKTNVGQADRIIRVLLAVVFGILYFTQTVTGPLSYILLALGGVFILTAMVGFCPLYTLFGMNTCKVNPKK